MSHISNKPEIVAERYRKKRFINAEETAGYFKGSQDLYENL